MGARATFRELCALWENLGREEEVGRRIKQARWGTNGFPLVKLDVLGKEHIMMQSLEDLMRAFVSLLRPTTEGRIETVKHMSLTDLFGSVLNKLRGEEALPGEKTRHSWNSIVNKSSEVEGRGLRLSTIAR